MQNQSKRIWDLFLESFKKSVSELNTVKPLSEYMKNKGDLTAFYKNELFEQIAKKMELSKSEKEYLRVDISLWKKDENLAYPVPHVFIESENDSVGDLENEIYKLACLNAPLKVLITRLPSLKKESDDLYQGEPNSRWSYILSSFAAENQLVGYFVVISLEWENDKPKYCHVIYNENAERIGEVETFFVE